MCRYPYSFVNLGPVLSSIIMFTTSILAYISATWMIEAISIANCAGENRRTDSLFREECYATPQVMRKQNDKDADSKESAYYVR